jgi:hypothetical protein
MARPVIDNHSAQAPGTVVVGASLGKVAVTLSVAMVFEIVAECGRSASLLFSTIYITFSITKKKKKKKKVKKYFIRQRSRGV